MKQNYKKLLILLPFVPMLMANSPAPRSYPQDYKDFTASIVNEETSPEDETRYLYTYQIKNTGTGYISSVSANMIIDGDELLYNSVTEEDFDPLFKNFVIAPNQEITAKSHYSSVKIDTNAAKYKAQAYYDFDDSVVVAGSYAITSGGYAENTYRVDVTLSYGNTDKYNYGLILKLIYDSKEYFIEVSSFDGFRFETYEPFDVNKLTSIEKVVVTRSVKYGYGVMNILTVIAIVLVVGFFLLVSGGIFCAIFFPIMKRRKRARQVNQ